jgi:hypothetical protein
MHLEVGRTNNNIVTISIKLLTLDKEHIRGNASNDRPWPAYTDHAFVDDSPRNLPDKQEWDYRGHENDRND